MKHRIMAAVAAAGFLGTTFMGVGQAKAFSLHDLVCDALETDPYYWAVYGAVEAAKASGLITSEMQCLDIGDTLNDLSIPDGTFKDCICEKIGWPAVNPPVCPDPHDICTPGGPLNQTTAMMSCQPSLSQNIAGKVCQFDGWCCSQGWDSICQSEAVSSFWSSMSAQDESIAMRTDLTCDQMNQSISQLQQEANADTAQLSCLGTNSNAIPFACMTGMAADAFEHAFNGECMGVSAGNMTNGTAIISWPCNAQPPGYSGAKDQAWVTDFSDCQWYNNVQYCEVRDAASWGKCLGVKAGNTANNTSLMIWDCLGHPDQYWSVAQRADGNYYFTDLASAKAGQYYGVHYNGTKSTFTLSTASPSTELPVTQ